MNITEKALTAAAIVSSCLQDEKGVTDTNIKYVLLDDYGQCINFACDSIMAREIIKVGEAFGDDDPMVSSKKGTTIVAVANDKHTELCFYDEETKIISIKINMGFNISYDKQSVKDLQS